MERKKKQIKKKRKNTMVLSFSTGDAVYSGCSMTDQVKLKHLKQNRSLLKALVDKVGNVKVSSRQVPLDRPLVVAL